MGQGVAMKNIRPIRKTKIDIDDGAEELISKALRCLEGRMKISITKPMSASRDVSNYLRLQLAGEKNEVFSILFLDNRHRLLAFEKMFFGTINEAVVYPRAVIQRALEHNAAAVIASHNHPSGISEPSQADIKITNDLKTILKAVDIKVLDHFIISHQETYSFAEHGLI
jgi:DNA repair protein RadC